MSLSENPTQVEVNRRYIEARVVESFTYTLCRAVVDIDIFTSLLIQNEFLTPFIADNIRSTRGESNVYHMLKLLRQVISRIETSKSDEDAETTFKRFVFNVLQHSDLQLVHIVEPMEDRLRESVVL